MGTQPTSMQFFRTAALINCLGSLVIGGIYLHRFITPQPGHGVEVQITVPPPPANLAEVPGVEEIEPGVYRYPLPNTLSQVREVPSQPPSGEERLPLKILLALAITQFLPALLWLVPIFASTRAFPWAYAGVLVLMPLGGILLFSLGMSWFIVFLFALSATLTATLAVGLHRAWLALRSRPSAAG